MRMYIIYFYLPTDVMYRYQFKKKIHLSERHVDSSIFHPYHLFSGKGCVEIIPSVELLDFFIIFFFLTKYNHNKSVSVGS